MPLLQRIIVIRHGYRQDWEPIEPQAQLHDGVSVPSNLPAFSQTERPNDPYLSNLGLQQAKEMAEYLAPLLTNGGSGGVAKDLLILTSPYIRCVQTTLAILHRFAELGVPEASLSKIHVEPRLREWYLPDDKEAAPPTASRAEVEKFLPGAKDLIEQESWNAITPGENLQRTKPELLESMRKLAVDLSTNARYRGRTVICVTHAASLVSLIRGFDIVNEPTGEPFAKEIHTEDGLPKPEPNYEVAIDGGYRVRSGVCTCNFLRRNGSSGPWSHTYEFEYLTEHLRDWQFRE
jgi:broad specificity phosphatase PhoE